MKKNNKRVLISYCLNIFFILVTLIFSVRYRALLINKIGKIVPNKKNIQLPTDEVLLSFNSLPELYYDDEYIIDDSYENISILFLGNSITVHGVVDGVWDHMSGMAAENKSDDYVHRLVHTIATEKKKNVIFSVINIASFEREYYKNSFNKDWLTFVTVQNPDIVIMQIGENMRSDVLSENIDIFTKEFKSIIETFKDAKTIITLPFWPDKLKNDVFTKIAIDMNCFVVDLSHLGSGLDYENFAKAEINYKNEGIGLHPGKKGMKKIEENIYTVINNLVF